MIVSLKKNLNSYFNNTLKCTILSVIAGSFFVLGFAPFRIFPLFFLSLFLMWVAAIYAKSLWYILLYNLLFTATVSVLGLYWIFYAIEYIIPSYLLTSLLFLGFIILYSLVYLPVLIFPYLKKSKKVFSLWLAFIGWILSEIIKLHILGGFPWFIPAQLWDFNLSLLQIISLVGVFSYSVITYLLVFILINSIISFNFKTTYSLISILVCLVFIVINYWYGYNRLKNKNTHAYNIPIRIVQPNISQKDKLNYNKVNYIFNKTIELTFKSINYKNPPEYIILPEVAFNTVIEKDNIMMKKLKKLLPSRSKLLLGSLTIENNKIYNTFEIITNTHENYPIYKKIKLVPFGEYLPFSNYLTFLLPLLGMENFSAGKTNVIYNINGKDRFAPLICFEVLFASKLLNYSNVNWLLNISNEAWFNNSIEQEQNLALTRLRAIEVGVPLVKVSNNGTSAIIDYTGKIIYKLQPYTPKVVDINLQIVTKNNIYSR